MDKAQFGMIGLGTMGRNFLPIVAEHGFSCVGFDLSSDKRQLLMEEGGDFEIEAAEDLKGFVARLEHPRKIMMLVPAGEIVDSVINDLVPCLEPGDIIIDGGNSHFTDAAGNCRPNAARKNRRARRSIGNNRVFVSARRVVYHRTMRYRGRRIFGERFLIINSSDRE